MQKGFATLEVVLAALIIALLMKATIPNVTRLIDRAALDYETKRLYSELRFLQAVNRSGTFDQMSTGLSEKKIEPLYIKFTGTSYQVVRGLDLNVTGKPVREVHYLSHVKKLSWKSGKTLSTISSDTLGKWNFGSDTRSDKLILTSRLNQKNYLVFDTVGRLRASLKDDDL